MGNIRKRVKMKHMKVLYRVLLREVRRKVVLHYTSADHHQVILEAMNEDKLTVADGEVINELSQVYQIEVN